jgi:hypothetical protein
MIFCVVNCIMCLLCWFSGCCYLCARKHIMTEKIRKTMLKASKSATAEGEADNVVEKMGGTRSDGLDGVNCESRVDMT